MPVSKPGAVVLGVVLALALLVPAQVASANTAEQLGSALQTLLNEQRRTIDIPGASATLIFADGSRWSGASGRANLVSREAVTPSTPFVVGSITKTFVAALILQLAEEGLLSLEDPLSRWLPNYPRASRYTLRQLLSHTSGVHNYFEHPDYSRLVFGRPTYAWKPNEVLSTFQSKPYFAPGSGFHYSNTGYVLLGRVAEKTTGLRLAQQLNARFTGPLGLSWTSFQGAGAPPSSTAKGYLRTRTGFREISDKTGYRPTRSAATVAWGAGDGVSTAADIATWARALYGGEVLTPGSLTDMLDYVRYGSRSRYGLGVMTRTLDGRRMYGHTGSLRGFVASMWHLPAENVTVVITTNRGRINANKIADALLRRALSDSTPPPTPIEAGSLLADRPTRQLTVLELLATRY